jgi:predicted nuclease with TOPRIM domain
MSDEKNSRKPLEVQIDELRAQVSELLKKLETAVDQEVDALRPKLRAAQNELRDLQQKSAAAWGDLKPGLQKAWDELHKSLAQAATRFKTRDQ